MPSKMLQAKAQMAYVTESRDVLEEQWIIQHLPLVRHLVQKITDTLHAAADKEDMISAGTLGLVKAARKYDPTRDAEFKTYAYIRIRGAILDEMRHKSFVPSAVYGQLRSIEKAHQKLAGEKGAAPDDTDLAAEVGISVEQLYRTLEEARRSHFMSIHGLTEDGPALSTLIPPDKGLSPEKEVQRREMSLRLAEAVRSLPRRDRMIILLYYERDLTMKETAEVLGITESRVSQLHAGALFKLSMKLRETS
ncbi:MAG: FliA/WhiG family RNA polymerase sigma factor [Planctomycetes bacterium]|nr:FliA/WhiG family RNA polymerase sigma factor [Planctomycetota bacterium]